MESTRTDLGTVPRGNSSQFTRKNERKIRKVSRRLRNEEKNFSVSVYFGSSRSGVSSKFVIGRSGSSIGELVFSLPLSPRRKRSRVNPRETTSAISPIAFRKSFSLGRSLRTRTSVRGSVSGSGPVAVKFFQRAPGPSRTPRSRATLIRKVIPGFSRRLVLETRTAGTILRLRYRQLFSPRISGSLDGNLQFRGGSVPGLVSNAGNSSRTKKEERTKNEARAGREGEKFRFFIASKTTCQRESPHKFSALRPINPAWGPSSRL